MRAPILAAALAAAACAMNAPSEMVHDMQIEDVSVRFEPSAPPRPVAHIRGIIPDGCSTLNAVEQIRTGYTVLVRVTLIRPTEAPCVQVVELFERDVPLEGVFPPGNYLVNVNGVAREFALAEARAPGRVGRSVSRGPRLRSRRA